MRSVCPDVTFTVHCVNMKVAIVTESFIPSANGVTTSVLRVLDHLKNRGHEAIIVCPGPAPESYRGFPVRTCTAVTVLGFRAGLPNPDLSRILTEFKPDVIHAASPFVLGAQALGIARRMHIPSVAVFQTDVAGFARQNGYALTANAAWRWLRVVHNSADLTLAPSGETLRDLAAWGIYRTALWGRGVDSVGFHPHNRTAPLGAERRREWALNDRVVVGYVGRLAPEKRVEQMAHLADDPALRIVIVGEGPSRNALGAVTAGSDAVFTGRLDGKQLGAAYSALDVFVHTGQHETFGQTLQEAMASGVPVVAPAAGGPLDIVDHGVTGYLYDPASPEQLREYVTALANDAALRARMGEAGRRKILPRSWESLGDQLLQYYRVAISTHDQTIAAPLHIKGSLPIKLPHSGQRLFG